MEFSYGIYDSSGNGITGSTSLKLKIRRQADSYLFDFNTTTFKASGWTTVAATMTQISAANLPGEYKYDVSVLSFDDGMYTAYFVYSGGGGVGAFVDSCEFGVYGGHGIDYNSYNIGGGGGGGGATAAECADAVMEEQVSEHSSVSGSLAAAIANILEDTGQTLPGEINANETKINTANTSIASILTQTTTLAGLVSDSKIAAQVKGIDANTITAGSIAADAIAVMTMLGGQYACANLTEATAEVAAQGITQPMVDAGVIQYVTFKISKTMNFQTPDLTFYLLYHYNASGKPDMRKPSLTTTW